MAIRNGSSRFYKSPAAFPAFLGSFSYARRSDPGAIGAFARARRVAVVSAALAMAVAGCASSRPGLRAELGAASRTELRGAGR